MQYQIDWKNVWVLTSIISWFSNDSFQFLSSFLASLVKNFRKDDFKYLSQEFDNNALYLVK